MDLVVEGITRPDPPNDVTLYRHPADLIASIVVMFALNQCGPYFVAVAIMAYDYAVRDGVVHPRIAEAVGDAYGRVAIGYRLARSHLEMLVRG